MADGHGEDRDDFKIRGAASRLAASKQPDPCTICLQPIRQRAVAVPCNHLHFDFPCLISWLHQRPTCPLCNSDVYKVEYDWRSPSDFRTYLVPRPGTSPSRATPRTSAPNAIDPLPVVNTDPSLHRRRKVYAERLYSLYVGTNVYSGYIDFSAHDFAHSATLQSRARTFLRRELQVFRFLDNAAASRGGNRQYLVEYIVAVLKTTHPKAADGQATELVAEFLGRDNASLLLHDLEAWLRSPFPTLYEWDREVQYLDSDTPKS